MKTFKEYINEGRKKSTQDEKSVIYNIKTFELADKKVYASSKNAKKAMEKMDNKDELKVASHLFYIDNIQNKINEAKNDYTGKLIIKGEKTFELKFRQTQDDIVVSIEDYRKLPLALKPMQSKRGYNIFKSEKSLLSAMKKRDTTNSFKFEIVDL